MTAACWRILILAVVLLPAGCAYQPAPDTVLGMSPGDARVLIRNTLLHDPKSGKPEQLSPDGGEVMSVEFAMGQIRIVTSRAMLNLPLAGISPKAEGSRVYLDGTRYIWTPYPDSVHLADALFTLKNAAAHGASDE